MTKTEALHTLAIRIASAKNNNEDYIDCVKVEALDEALEALKGQNKVILEGTWERIFIDQWLLNCPFCDHAVIESCLEDTNYCPNCGARLKK